MRCRKHKVFHLLAIVVIAAILVGCNAKAPNVGAGTITATMNDIANLQKDLKSNTDMKEINDKYSAVCITQPHANHTFNLVRYDANPIGLGTLERTWTFLQVISKGGIEVFTLYEKSAEYPLGMEITDLPNGNLLITITGVTNASRSNSSFKDLWEYSAGTLKMVTPSPTVYWRGWPYAFRENMLDVYLLKEIEDNDFIQSSEGSLVAGYYKNEELRIIKITVCQSRHQVILRFYPFNDAVVMIEEVIRYATDKPLHEVTEDDMRLDKVEQAIIKDGQLYYYIDEREPMYPSDNTWYAEIYAKALEALDDA